MCAGDVAEVLGREQLLLAVQQVQAMLLLPAELTAVLHHCCWLARGCCLGQEGGADDRVLQHFLLLEHGLPLVGAEHVHCKHTASVTIFSTCSHIHSRRKMKYAKIMVQGMCHGVKHTRSHTQTRHKMTRLWHKQYVTVPSTLTHTHHKMTNDKRQDYGTSNMSRCQAHSPTHSHPS